MDDIGSSLWDAYVRGELVDLEVVCGGVVFKVHKIVICLRSSVFKAMVQSQFKEGVENKITLDDESSTFASVVEWMYKSKYLADTKAMEEVPGMTLEATQNSLCHDSKIYAFADKYDMPELAKEARDGYERTLRWALKNIKTDTDLDPDIFESISIVYATTPSSNRGLRNVVINALRAFGPLMCGFQPMEPANVVMEALSKVIQEEPQIAIDLLQKVFENTFCLCVKCATGRNEKRHSWKCMSCSQYSNSI